MKKILLGLFCFFLNLVPVLASYDTYYSPYGEYGPYVEEKPEENDTTLIETERRYLWYSEEINKGDYYIEGENPSTYPLRDVNDKKEVTSAWGTEKPESKKNRVIHTQNLTTYDEIEPIRYVHLYHLHGGASYLFKVSEIEVYAGKEKIDYTPYCTGCSSSFVAKIKDGNIRQNDVYVNDVGTLYLDLGEQYSLDDLKIRLYIYDDSTTLKQYSMKFGNTIDNHDDNCYMYGYYEKTFQYSDVSEIVAMDHDINTWKKLNPVWRRMTTTDIYTSSNAKKYIDTVTRHRAIDTLYRYYALNRITSTDYLLEGLKEYPNKDEEHYKDFYRIKTRDKLVLESNPIITSYDTALTDFIIESTNHDIKIDGEVDYYHNGTYPVTYVLPYESITKEVVVNIEENVKRELEERIEALLHEIENLKGLIQEKEKQITDLENDNHLLETELEHYKNLLEECSQKKDILDSLIEDLLKKEDLKEQEKQILEEEKQKLEESIIEINDLYQNVNNALKKSQKEGSEWETKYQALRKEYVKLMQQYEYLMTTGSTCEGEEVLKQEFISLNDSYLSLKDEYNHLQNRNVLLEKEMRKLENNEEKELAYQTGGKTQKVSHQGFENYGIFFLLLAVFLLIVTLWIAIRRRKQSNE